MEYLDALKQNFFCGPLVLKQVNDKGDHRNQYSSGDQFIFEMSDTCNGWLVAHELAHFLEIEIDRLMLPNFGLPTQRSEKTMNKKAVIREGRVLLIQSAIEKYLGRSKQYDDSYAAACHIFRIADADPSWINQYSYLTSVDEMLRRLNERLQIITQRRAA